LKKQLKEKSNLITFFFIQFNMNLNDKLKQLKIEDFIWVIYIGIIILSWYSNSLERKYYCFNDLESKKKYREIMTTIFIILIIVYFYFLMDSINSLKNIDENTSEETKKLLYLSFLASLFIFISGLIFLYISIKDEDLNVELAFN